MNLNIKSKVHELKPIVSNALMGDTHRDFHLKKREVMAYRFIFLAFGIFFTAISFYLSLKTANWTYHMLFGFGTPVKSALTFSTAVLALGSLWIGCKLRTEYELMKDMRNKAILHLRKIYKQKRSPTSLIVSSTHEAEKDRDLRLQFEDALETINSWCHQSGIKLETLENNYSFNQALKLKAKIDWLKTLKLQLQEVLDQFESELI